MKAKSIVSIIGTLVLVVFVLAIGAGVYLHFTGDNTSTSDFYVLYNGKEISSDVKGYKMSTDKAVTIYVVDKTAAEGEETEYTVKVVPNAVKDKDFNFILDGESTSYQSIKDLTEGFDMPQLQTVFVRKSSRLPMIQMAGRVLRNHPGKQIANIVQPKNTPFPAKKMADPEQILHWRRDRFVALNGQNNILTSTLRKTLELRNKLKKSEPKIVCEFSETYYVSV